MSVPDTVDGLPARSVFHTVTMPPRRRRSAAERLRRVVRRHIGMGVFLVMLITSVAIVAFAH